MKTHTLLHPIDFMNQCLPKGTLIHNLPKGTLIHNLPKGTLIHNHYLYTKINQHENAPPQ
jgi:hypothetical protein